MDNVKYTLKTIREIRGYTQEQAALGIGISVDTLGKYERGITYPNIPVLRRIEEFYEISYNNIIFLPLDYGKTVIENKEVSHAGN